MENNLENKSTEDLENLLKMLKIIAYSLTVLILILLCFSIYGLLFSDNNGTFIALFAVGISLFGILPIQFSSMNKIKKEIASRK